MSDQIDPAFKAAYRETQGQPVDAKPRAWDGYAHAVASSSELAGTEWETNDQPVGAVARRPIVAAQQDGGLVERLKDVSTRMSGHVDAGDVWDAATALAEKDARIAELLAADEVRARVISRLTFERDASRAECEGLRAALEGMLFEYGDKYDSECRLKGAGELDIIAKARAALSQKETGA